jgi:phosphoribosylaminoimidazole-succinocarboxamide synthase
MATMAVVEGKTKIIRDAQTPGEIEVTFKDAATAFNGQKFAEIPGKGVLNATISAHLFGLLGSQGVSTCFVRKTDSPNTLIFRRLSMIPLEVVVRNFAYGSACKRYNLPEGKAFKKPVIEYYWKNDAANDPLLSEGMVDELDILPQGVTLDQLSRQAVRINSLFLPYFESCGLRCADYKLEFGLDSNGKLVLGDELSPDNFRFRDIQTGQVLDKDVFRFDLGDVSQAYQELHRRLKTDQPLEQPKVEGCQSCKPCHCAGKIEFMGEVIVKSRKGILNPESKTILESLKSLGYHGIKGLHAQKRFEISIMAQSKADAEECLKAIADNVLSNPVIEDCQVALINV